MAEAPDNRLGTLLARGWGYVDTKDWELALYSFKAALAVSKDDPEARAGVAFVEPHFARDNQTGVYYLLHPEDRLAKGLAAVAAVWLLVMLILLGAMLLMTWLDTSLLPTLVDDHLPQNWVRFSLAALSLNTYQLLVFAALGGSLGGTIQRIRSLITWHCERGAYGPRFIWAELVTPPAAGAVGTVAYLLARGGAGIVNGNISLTGGPGAAAFAVAFLAGYSTHHIFKWFDAQVSRLFNIETSAQDAQSQASNPVGPHAA